MRYRLTTRGKIVLVVFAILIVASGISLLSPSKPTDVVAEPDTDQTQSKNVESVAENTDVIKEENQPLDEKLADEDEASQATKTDETMDKAVEEALKAAGARLYFKPDKHELVDSELEKLKPIIETYKEHTDQMIIIEGNINGYPQYDDTEFGMTLSDKRGDVVKKYLVEQGVSQDKIHIFSLGSQKPIQNTSNLSECWKNRRTDVYFKDYNDLEY